MSGSAVAVGYVNRLVIFLRPALVLVALGLAIASTGALGRFDNCPRPWDAVSLGGARRCLCGGSLSRVHAPMITKRTPAPWTRAGVGVGMKSQATLGITAPTRRRSKPEATNRKPQPRSRDPLRSATGLSRDEMTSTMISPTIHPDRRASMAHITRGFRHPGLANPPDQVLVDRTWQAGMNPKDRSTSGSWLRASEWFGWETRP